MDNKTRRLVNREYWEIKKISSANSDLCSIINTHQREGDSNGSTEPTVIKESIKMDEAIKFLEEKFNESRNKNKK